MPISHTSSMASAGDFLGTLETYTVTLDASTLQRVQDNFNTSVCRIFSNTAPMIQPRWPDARGAGLVGLGLSAKLATNLAPSPVASYTFCTGSLIANPTSWVSVDTGSSLWYGLTRQAYVFKINASVGGVTSLPAGRCNYFPFDSAATTYLTALFGAAPLGLYFSGLIAGFECEFVTAMPATKASWTYQQEQFVPWWWWPNDVGAYSSFADYPRPAIAGDASAAVYFQPDLSPIDDFTFSTSQRTALATMQVIGPGYRRTSLRSHQYIRSMYRGLPSATSLIAWNNNISRSLGAAAPTWSVTIYYYDSSLVLIGSGVVLQTGTCTLVGTKYGADWYGRSGYIDFSTASPPSNARYFDVDTTTSAGGNSYIVQGKLDESTGAVFGTRPFPWPSVNVETGDYKPGVVIDL
jgi:hypothetical protein